MLGDYVYYKKDKIKILYIVREEKVDTCTIVGVYYRIIKSCDKTELIQATIDDINKEKQEFTRKEQIIEQSCIRNKKHLLGRILHIDGDEEYLNKCIELYNKMNVFSYGITIEEDKMKKDIGKYVNALYPDIVVITGHDLYNNTGVKDLNNYVNTLNFIEAIKEVRKIKGRNDCTIIAGACQSNFEALIASGADFASSPKRINIHTFDPAVIAIKVATTSFNKIVSLNDLNKFVENGKEAFNGVETLGKMRIIL